MRVNIEDVVKTLEHLRSLDSVPLADIKWFHKGVQVKPKKQNIEEFEFTGLSNSDFVELELLPMINSDA